MKRKSEFKREAGDGFARVQPPSFEPGQKEFYADALRILNQSGVRYVLTGAFALHHYTGLWRNTKDLDVFLRPRDVEQALAAFAKAGYETEIREPHWLSKAWSRPYFVDLIFGMANGNVRFDRSFVTAAEEIDVAGERAPLIRLEELIVSKVYIAVRDRFDGGDVAHLIRASKGKIDWARVLKQLGDNRLVLLWQLVLFTFVYPGHTEFLPHRLMEELFEEMKQSWKSPRAENSCFGMLLDAYSFAADIFDWGYRDPRDLRPYHQRKEDAA